MAKIKCECGGMPAPRTMCINVIVGGKYCSLPAGKCKFQSKEETNEKDN